MKHSIENVFKKPTDQEKTQAALESNRELNIAGDRARACLNLKEFEAYRQDYVEAEAKIIEDLIAYTNAYVSNPAGDVFKYAFTVMRLLTRLQDYRSLLKKVDSAAAKKEVKPSEPAQ